jgi:hypothetical protein
MDLDPVRPTRMPFACAVGCGCIFPTCTFGRGVPALRALRACKRRRAQMPFATAVRLLAGARDVVAASAESPP